MKSIRSAILLAILLAATHTARAAAPVAGGCRAQLDQIAGATGARLDHISFSGRFAVLIQRDINRLSVACARGDGPLAVEGDLWTAYPRAGYYTALAKASSVLAGQRPPIVEAALRRCFDAAIRDDDEIALIQGVSFQVECHAYLRSEGKLIMVITPRTSLAPTPRRFPRAPGPLPGPAIGPTE